MKDDNKTKKQLIHELAELHSQNAALGKTITGNISYELAVEEARRYAESIVETVREPLLVLDADLKIISANRNFYKTFKVTPGETIGSFIYDLGNKQWDIPKLRELLEEVLPEKEAFDDFEVAHNFQDIGPKIMLLNARQIYRKDIGAKMILLAIEDITERRRLESLLIDTEEQYRRLFETASDGIILLEKREGKITQANPATEKLLGYTKKESVGNKLQDIGVVLDTSDFQTTMQNLNKSGIINYRNVKVETKSGQNIDTEIYLVDRAKLVQCNIRDVTEHKKTQEALRASEELFRNYLENAPDGVYMSDVKGNFLYGNRKCEEIIGYRREELIGKNFLELNILPERSLKKAAQLLKANMEGKPTGPDEVELISKEGRHIPVEISTSVVQSRGQGIVLAFVRDVTERKRAGKELRESNRRYREFFATSRDCVFITSMEGKWIDFNDAALDIFGYDSREELSQVPISSLYVNLEERSMLMALIEKQGYVKEHPVQLRRRDGAVIDALITSGFRQNTDGFEKEYYGTIRDITHHKQAEEALRESEEKYSWVLNNMADVIVVMDMNLRFTYVSPSIMRMRGYTAEEATAQTLEQVMTPESLQIVAKVFEEEMKLEASGTADPARSRIVEVEQYRKDGSIVLMENHLSFLRDETQKAVGIISLTRDITDRKRAEETLKESEKKYRLLADNVNDVIFVLDMNLKYTYVSPSVKILRGYEPEEVMKQAPSEILTPSSLDLAMKTLAEALELERTEHREINIFRTLQLEMIRKDGTTVWTEVKFSAIRDKNQQPVGILGLTRDITERRQAEETLLESEEQYRLVVENAKESIIISQDVKVVFANRAAIGMIGYSKEILTSKSFTDFIHPDDLNMVVDHHIRRIKGEEVPPVYPFRVIGQDGTVIWCELNAAVIQWKGKPATLLFLTNITERKRADEELKESESKYRLLADNVDDVIFVLDMNLNYTYASPSVKILMGYEPEELLKRRASETMTPSSWDLATKNLSEELEKYEQGEINKLQVLQLEMIRKDGSTVWTEVKISFIRDENRRPVGIIGVSRDITERMKAEEELQQTLESLRKAVGVTIQVMVSAVEMRDPYTAGHQIKVANLACAIAKEMGLPKDKIEGLRMAGSIHDIGKLSIPAEILSKPTKLTNIEFSLIKEHSLIGYEMLKDVESPWPLAQIVYQHHERMDGSGYPRNLKGDEILMEARIMAIADVVESMASHRPYRPALGIEVALEEIEKNKGILYDNAVADACLKLFREKGYQLT
jgi:PAS domain S-box-containing protein/putative nucleotidyltransferase with HDIG domain